MTQKLYPTLNIFHPLISKFAPIHLLLIAAFLVEILLSFLVVDLF